MKDFIKEQSGSDIQKVPMVTEDDIVIALKKLGVTASDIVLTHSSLKSFGYVVGGPMSVINAVKKTVTESGTMVFPTLVQKDFANAYTKTGIL